MSSSTVLDELVGRYRHWIGGLPATAGQPSRTTRRETLRRHMADAAAAADRMEAGIRLLRADEDVRRAFQMTNRAMAQQRSRQEHHRSGAVGNPPSTDGARWRPFQIAFILLNLAGLADADHPDREMADLLWFPTGGGKTEAYLGIIGIADPAAASPRPACGGRLGAHALHAAAAHPPAVPAGHRAHLRAGDRAPDPPPGHGADLDRPVGRSGRRHPTRSTRPDERWTRRESRGPGTSTTTRATRCSSAGAPGAVPRWTTRTTRSSTGAGCGSPAAGTTAPSATDCPSTSSTMTSTPIGLPSSSAPSTSSR